MEGVTLALEWSNEPLIIQSDCANVLSFLKDPGKNRTCYGHLINEVKRLLSGQVFKLQKISRDQNRVADRLANYSRAGVSVACMLNHAPDCITQLLLADCNTIIK
jgi:hypothetical protein